jgi:hypothetical protein
MPRATSSPVLLVEWLLLLLLLLQVTDFGLSRMKVSSCAEQHKCRCKVETDCRIYI